MPLPVTISAAVEGDVDEAVARKLIRQAGGAPGAVYGKNGKSALRERIAGYDNAARRAPWLVLVDLHGDAEALDNSKTAMVNLARRSRRTDIRADMVPREGSGRAVGPAYTSRLIEYVETRWRPAAAAARSESLRRALACLKRLAREAA